VIVPAPEKVRRIAVLRANALGDFVLALPALTDLRAAYPWAEIVLLGRPWHQALLAGRTSPVDRVEVAPLDDPDAPTTFCARLREQAFDLALQWHGGGAQTNPFVRALGARLTAGWRAAGAPPLDLNLRYEPHHPVGAHLQEAAALIGVRGTLRAPHWTCNAADFAVAAQALPAAQPSRPTTREADLVILQPGATDARRCWPVSQCAALADQLAERGWRIVVHGGPGETPRVAEVMARMRQRAQALAPGPELGGLGALLARARLVVGSDTGPIHLARAVGTPTVTVIWIGNLRPYGPPASPRHRVAVGWRLDCPVCGRRNVTERCAHDASFVADVSVAEVLALCLAELESPPPAGGQP